MIKNLLCLLFLSLSISLSAQYVLINAPQNCEGALRYSPTADWGAMLNSDVWTGDVVVVDDGTAAPTEGCSALVNGAEVMGKIAFIDRGSCNFSLKALNAQNAGAIAVIIANNLPMNGTLTMGAGNFATDVTIPAVMVNFEDGQKIKNEIANGNTVNMSIGALQFDNDYGVELPTILFPGFSTIPVNQVTDAGDFIFTPGAAVYNLGRNEATSVVVEGKINYMDGSGGSTEVYSSSETIASVASGDTSALVILENFDPSSTGTGQYEYTYNVTGNETDEVAFDNEFVESLYVTDNVMSNARWDAANNRPMRTNGYTIAGGGPIEMLSPFEIPNGTDIMVDSILFNVSTSLPTLAGIEITVFLYKWDDADGDGNFAAEEVEVVAFGVHVFDNSETLADAWVTVVPEDFQTGDFGYKLSGDNERLIVGTRYTGNDLVFFGFDEGVNLDQYINNLQVPSMNFNDAQLPYGQTSSFGVFGADFDQIGLFIDNWAASNTSLYLNKIEVSTRDLTDEEASIQVFPNPASDVLTVELELAKLDNNQVQYQIVDMQGRTIYQSRVSGVYRDVQRFDVSNLATGQYELIIDADQGRRSTSFVVK